MKHALRKYLSNRGSALFMVLSLMTALMILVMAMYFSVVSSREVQLKVFNQEQAYRSSVSIADAIAAGLNNHSWLDGSGASGEFEELVQSLSEGQTVSTGANGFDAFGATGTGTKLEDEELGAYTVSITRLQDEGDKQVFDIAVTVSVGGVIDTTHTFMYVEQPKGENDQGDNIFTSTGYVPNDTYLDYGFYPTDIFCDNENTVIGSSNGGNTFMGDIYTGGSLTINLAPKFAGGNPATVAVRGDLRVEGTWNGASNPISSMIDLDGGGDNVDTGNLGLLMVGGDCYFTNNVIMNCDIYIAGDLYISCGTNNIEFGNIFVGGDLIFTDDVADWQKAGDKIDHVYFYTDQFNNHGSIINGEMYGEACKIPNSVVPYKDGAGNDTLAETMLNGIGMTWDQFMDKLGELTETEDYYKWEIDPAKLDLGVKYDKDTGDVDGDGDKEEYLTFPKKGVDGKYEGKPVTVRFTTGDGMIATPDDNVLTDIPGQVSTYYFDWQGKTAANYFPDGSTLKYSAVTIEDIVCQGTGVGADGGGYVDGTIIFDTGDDPKGQFIVNLIPNRDTDGDGTKDTFMWTPADGSIQNMGIFTRGNGTLVIRIPNGMTYQDLNFGTMMHETWYAILGGDIYRNNVGSFTDRVQVSDDSGSGSGLKIYVDNMIYSTGGIRITSYTEVLKYIHSECGSGCTDCSYASSTSTEKCDECGIKMKQYYCARHNTTYTYCGTASCSEYEDTEKNAKELEDLCKFYIDRTEVASRVSALAGTPEYDVIGGTNFKYPNTNIFIVSCDENADIRLGLHNDGAGIQQNKIFGFVYAPYMTFKAAADIGAGAAGGTVRLCGGLIVSDYIISDYHSLVMCYPTSLPGDLMSKDSVKLVSNDRKDWKVSIAGH